ncbi:MAG TPA: hypothetical protein PKJ24_11120, partial [Prolixibacteraceae bacterium]|nr:hypothetical protein [Prolixibacteraceae bacterium]
TTPDTLRVALEFETCEVMWQHRLWGTGDLHPAFNNGIFFHGQKATLFASDDKLVLMPSGKNQLLKEINLPTPEMQDNHVAIFIDAVRERNKKAIACTPEDAFRSTATVQLGMISYYSGKPLVWNETSREITNQKKMEHFLARPYREGYRRPEG